MYQLVLQSKGDRPLPIVRHEIGERVGEGKRLLWQSHRVERHGQRRRCHGTLQHHSQFSSRYNTARLRTIARQQTDALNSGEMGGRPFCLRQTKTRGQQGNFVPLFQWSWSPWRLTFLCLYSFRAQPGNPFSIYYSFSPFSFHGFNGSIHCI